MSWPVVPAPLGVRSAGAAGVGVITLPEGSTGHEVVERAPSPFVEALGASASGSEAQPVVVGPVGGDPRYVGRAKPSRSGLPRGAVRGAYCAQGVSVLLLPWAALVAVSGAFFFLFRPCAMRRPRREALAPLLVSIASTGALCLLPARCCLCGCCSAYLMGFMCISARRRPRLRGATGSRGSARQGLGYHGGPLRGPDLVAKQSYSPVRAGAERARPCPLFWARSWALFPPAGAALGPLFQSSGRSCGQAVG